MAYSPGVYDTSGQIYGQFLVGAGKAKAEGIEGAARIRAEQRRYEEQQWAAGIQQFGQAFSKSMEGVQKNQTQRDYMKATMEGLASKGIVDAPTLEKFSKASLGAQQAMVVDAQSVWDTYKKSKEAEEQMNLRVRENQLKLGQEREGLGQPYFTPVKQPDGTVKMQQTGFQSGPTSITQTTPVKPENRPNEPSPRKVLIPKQPGEAANAPPRYGLMRPVYHEAGQYWDWSNGELMKRPDGSFIEVQAGPDVINYVNPTGGPAPQ